MTTQTEALKLALEALNEWRVEWSPAFYAEEYDSDEPEENTRRTLVKNAITAIKEALAQPAVTESHKQEFVRHRDGYWCDDLTCKKCYSADFRFKHKNSVDKESLTTEAQRKPLTTMEVYDVVHDADLDWHTGFVLGEDENRFVVFARAIEAAHGIKE